MRFQVLGRNLPRLDAVAKATGDTEYTVDRSMPGMLYGRILRSPHAHALIKSIDTSQAATLKGVRSVITAKDVPMNRFSFMQHLADKTMLCDVKVRCVGDEIAAVAADTPEIAAEAVERIGVQYEVLPAVFDPQDAMRPEAPLVHEGQSNMCFQTRRVTGDPDKAFEECDYVCEDRYSTHHVSHCCLEVSNCIAKWASSGKLTIWVNTQAPHTQRQEVARILGIPVHQVRIIGSAVGGGFGSKLVMDMKVPIAAVLSRQTGRSVKIENTRAEEFSTGKTRYACTIYVKTGAKKNGTLWAREMKVIGDNGAYHDKGPGTLSVGATAFSALYNVPNSKHEACLVYTNKQMGTAFRGFGNPQVTFAMEAQLDALAEKMGMDPLDLRLKNANGPGQVTHCGVEISSCGLVECMTAASQVSGWKEKRLEKGMRGIGLANVMHTGGGSRVYGYSAADTFIKLSEDGKVTIITPAPDMGQGAHTAIAQIVAEELGVGLEDTRVIADDTDLTPYDLGAWASRTTFVCGNSALAAARETKKEILQVASQMMEANAEDIVVEKGRIFVAGSPGTHVTFPDLVEYAIKKRGEPISGKGRFVDRLPDGYPSADAFKKNIPTFAFGTQVVEVEVDPETGVIKVLKVTAAHDLGRAVNKAMAEGQVEGSVVQGIGYALMENLVIRKGRPLNDSFLDYKIPRIADVPPIETILVETDDPDGPFGAKGLGEPAIVPTAAAIANAVYNACGVRIRKLPILPEDILKALRDKNPPEPHNDSISPLRT